MPGAKKDGTASRRADTAARPRAAKPKAAPSIPNELASVREECRALGRDLAEVRGLAADLRRELAELRDEARRVRHETHRILPTATGVAVVKPAPDPAIRIGITVDSGVVVAEVSPESPAAAAGLSVGDVIAAIDGSPILSAAELRDRIANVKDGANATVTRTRRGIAEDVRVQFETPADHDSDQRSRLGMTVDPCLVVAAVQPGDPAALAGLVPGDAITAVDGTPVATAAEFREAVQRHAPAAGMILRVVRGRQTQDFTIRLGEPVT